MMHIILYLACCVVLVNATAADLKASRKQERNVENVGSDNGKQGNRDLISFGNFDNFFGDDEGHPPYPYHIPGAPTLPPFLNPPSGHKPTPYLPPARIPSPLPSIEPSASEEPSASSSPTFSTVEPSESFEPSSQPSDFASEFPSLFPSSEVSF